MAGYEVNPLSTTESVTTLNETVGGFRDFYGDQGALELGRVSLISKHDPSIRFTNSTTSVMKPLLRGEAEIPEEGVYLTQPAMGSQGIQYWLAGEGLGPFASYFTSMGSLYLPHHGGKALSDMTRLACEQWGLEEDELRMETFVLDDGLLDLARTGDVRVTVGAEEPDFRHVYGMPGTEGRNTNLVTVTNGLKIGLGTLTEIYTVASGTPIAWEVSFDTAPVTAARKNAGHPIAAGIAAAALHDSQRWGTDDEFLVAADCASISAAIMLEGMVPQSKGRAGTLRKFFGEFGRLSRAQGLGLEDAQKTLLEVVDLEAQTRPALSPEHSPSVDIPTARNNIVEWTERLWAQ